MAASGSDGRRGALEGALEVVLESGFVVVVDVVAGKTDSDSSCAAAAAVGWVGGTAFSAGTKARVGTTGSRVDDNLVLCRTRSKDDPCSASEAGLSGDSMASVVKVEGGGAYGSKPAAKGVKNPSSVLGFSGSNPPYSISQRSHAMANRLAIHESGRQASS